MVCVPRNDLSAGLVKRFSIKNELVFARIFIYENDYIHLYRVYYRYSFLIDVFFFSINLVIIFLLILIKNHFIINIHPSWTD